MTNNEPSKEKNSLASAAFVLFKKDYRKNLAASFTFLMIEIMVIAVAYAYSFSLIVTVPFLLIPFFFALQMSVSSYKGGAPLSSRVFLRFFGLYFSPSTPFYGVYRVFLCLLKALGVAFLSSLLIGGVYYSIAVSVDPSFLASVDQLGSIIESGTSQDLYDFLASNGPIMLYQRVLILSSYGLGFYMFVHALSVNTLNPYVRMALQGAPSRVANGIFGGGFKEIRRGFYKEYYKSLWPGILLLVGGYLAGIGFGLVWFTDPDRLFVLGLAGSGLFTFAFIPYLLDVVELLATRYEKNFAEYSLNMAKRTLDQLKAERQLSDKEISDMEDQLKRAQDLQNLKSPEKGDEDKKDGENQDPK